MRRKLHSNRPDALDPNVPSSVFVQRFDVEKKKHPFIVKKNPSSSLCHMVVENTNLLVVLLPNTDGNTHKILVLSTTQRGMMKLIVRGWMRMPRLPLRRWKWEIGLKSLLCFLPIHLTALEIRHEGGGGERERAGKSVGGEGGVVREGFGVSLKNVRRLDFLDLILLLVHVPKTESCNIDTLHVRQDRGEKKGRC